MLNKLAKAKPEHSSQKPENRSWVRCTLTATDRGSPNEKGPKGHASILLRGASVRYRISFFIFDAFEAENLSRKATRKLKTSGTSLD